MHVQHYILMGLGLMVVWALVIYNRLIRLRNLHKEAFSGVDVQLKRRHDLVPMLVEAVKGYMQHESDTLQEVTSLRRRAMETRALGELAPLENELADRVARLIVTAESYPGLKADVNFRQLMTQLVEVEDQLQYARRYFNGAVRELNNAVQCFPSNIVAGLCTMRPEEFFQVESCVRQAPQVRLAEPGIA